MIKYSSLFLFFSLILSCNQNSPDSAICDLEDLKERVAILEGELQAIKSKTDSFEVFQEELHTSESSDLYFVIGSTIDEVIEVMGDPTTYIDLGTLGKRFHYGVSTVFFEEGKVKSYDNLEGNLKVRIK